MRTLEIRELFLEFFKQKGHVVMESAPLVPINDPSLLWINAGVVPLKRYFDGSIVPDNKKIVNSQKCIRTNDIENVGYTARHHTYFEMLGNFSIGDYFKKDAIPFAFEFLTSKEWIGFDVERLYMTYYPSDTESKDIWLSLGIKENHLIPLEGNFWEIGEGPCGPCTEIFYDRGEEYANGGIELLEKDIENDRYIEIWNVVLSQFNGKAELKREEYPELPSKNIDTGMGLERMACIIQDVPTNFEIDIFMDIMKEIEILSSIKYDGQTEFKVIADHIRTLCLAISDSALPSNEGRGYVIRRILRRAVNFGVKLGFDEPFMYKLVDVVNKSLPIYDFTDKADTIKTIIKNEEEKFYKTLEAGEKKLDEFIKRGEITGKDAFLLYDTFGFPVELTVELAAEKNIKVNIEEYKEYLEAQKERSRSSRTEEAGLDKQSEVLLDLKVESNFVGYEKNSLVSKVISIIQNDALVESATGIVGVVLDNTPFYAESGGQVSDRGTIGEYEVLSVVKAPHGQHIHFIDAKEEISFGEYTCSIDEKYREYITNNHSATHLLNYALKDYFGEHIKQQGSYVCDEYLRFDFTHFDSISDDNIVEIENLVNKYISEWNEIEITTMSIDEAKEKGAAALFGEKYGDVVRVVKLGDSLELCGGTHITNFDNLKKFAISSIESKGSGVYRITATTNDFINVLLKKSFNNIATSNIEQIEKLDKVILEIEQNVDEKNYYKEIVSKCNQKNLLIEKEMSSYKNRLDLIDIKNDISKLKKELDKLVKDLVETKALTNFDISNDISNNNGLKYAIVSVSDIDVNATKSVVDTAFLEEGLDFIFVANTHNNVVFIAKCNDNAISKGINCGNIVKEAAIICGGNGGGRANFAQAGGKNAENVEESLENVRNLLLSIC